jgi:hypothetical protein
MTINAIQELENLGYVFQLTQNGIRFEAQKKCQDSEKVAALLDRIRTNKAAAMEFLARRQPAEMVPLVELHEWLEARGLRITGPSWVDRDGRITVRAESANV